MTIGEPPVFAVAFSLLPWPSPCFHDHRRAPSLCRRVSQRRAPGRFSGEQDQPTAVVVGHRGAGEMFGETSLLKAGVATASIVTDSDEAILVCIDGMYALSSIPPVASPHLISRGATWQVPRDPLHVKPQAPRPLLRLPRIVPGQAATSPHRSVLVR